MARYPCLARCSTLENNYTMYIKKDCLGKSGKWFGMSVALNLAQDFFKIWFGQSVAEAFNFQFVIFKKEHSLQ